MVLGGGMRVTKEVVESQCGRREKTGTKAGAGEEKTSMGLKRTKGFLTQAQFVLTELTSGCRQRKASEK